MTKTHKDYSVDEIRIENLRSLKDTGYIKLKRINIFLGQNSSGKSTFVRTLPLLKQSLQERTKSGILWYGKYVDFGSFKEATCNLSDTDKNTIDFTFVIDNLEVKDEHVFLPTKTQIKNPQAIKPGRVEITAMVSKDSQRLSKFRLTIKNYVMSFSVADNVVLKEFDIDGIDYLAKANFGYTFYLHYGLLPLLFPQQPGEAPILAEDLLRELLKELDGESSIDSLLISELTFQRCSDKATLAQYLKISEDKINDTILMLAGHYVLTKSIPYIWDSLRDQVNRFTANVQYVTPIRASAERYYRIQGLSVEELDPQGANLAMFLHSLSTHDAKYFSDWIQKNMGFSVTAKSTEGHASILISDKNNKKINMADTGFGYSQVIPILAQIWKAKTADRRSDPICYVLEQPELHLHPKMQARLADVLISAIQEDKKSRIQLIIETHSETFINQLGKAIDNKALKSSDVGIYLFDKGDSDGITHITESTFDDKGFLTKWPYGFFDS
ncbi:hypothetical protein PCPL58_5216 [Pseudomonas cerasi]|uniref:Endonuclease GajA/Old nuclease/RecF-like AAA domain-containing protein n=1 Tax=Pseudomonas cerasi TaxID=1583341 RepID=A0A193SYM3_9PSED|nr:hypothetical protein PCPL58_5216 [Pseudomonas cerasi]SOS24399.1 hypothetical protein PL963_05314 [Pseudomonas cerasi]